MRTLFQNGWLYDGTGAPARRGSLLIDGETIAAVDAQEGAQADLVLDCEGLAVAPGFIDSHSHNDWFACRPDPLPYFAPFLEQGIATQVAGNCGFSPFGWEADTPHRALIGSGLFSLLPDVPDVHDLPGFAAACGRPPVNLLPLYGHMSGRISLAGYDPRPLTAEELDRLDDLMASALEAGAGGISLGLMYEPDRYAPYEELRRAARMAQRYGRVLTVHARACSAASTSYSPPVGGRAHNLRALDEMLALARETGVKLQFSHLIFVGARTWRTVDEALRLIDRANAEGLSFHYDSYAMMYGASVITVVLPPWYLTLPESRRRSAAVRARLAVEIGVTKKLLGFDFDDIVITWAGDQHRDIAGLNVKQIARRWGRSALDTYLQLVDDTRGQGRVLMYKYLTPEILSRLMADEKCLYMTDAWIEDEGMQNPAAFSCFPEFLRLGREKGTLPHVVRQMTGAAADRFGLTGRGYLRPGFHADVTVFDPRTAAPGPDPAGRPVGIRHVFVNGEHAVKDGAALGLRAGQVLAI